MKVLTTFPPMYAEINKEFNVRGKPVIFTFADVIHNPSRITITPELMVHEEVHSQRQGDNPESWWADYLTDPEFRLAEELPAHQAEFAYLCGQLTDGVQNNDVRVVRGFHGTTLYA